MVQAFKIKNPKHFYLVVLVVLGFGIFLCADNLDASPDLPVDHWVYDALEKLAMLGMTDLTSLSTRPLSRMAVAHKVAEIIEKVQNEKLPFSILRDELAITKAENLLYRLMDEFESELIRLGVEVIIKSDKPPKPISFKLFDRIEKTSAYVSFSKTSTKNIKLDNKKGWTLEEDFNAHGMFRSWATYEDILGFSIEPAFYVSKDESKLTLDEAFVNANYKNIELGIGRTSFWWGPGKHGSLLLSNNTRPLYLAKVGSAKPFRIPYIEKIGLWNIRFFTAKLIDETSGTIKEPCLSGLRVEFSPHKRLNLGAIHTIMWGGEGAPHTSVIDLMDMFFSKLGGGADEPENHLVSFTGEWAVPGLNQLIPIASCALLYGELGAEDENKGMPEYLGGLGGLKIMDLFMMEDLDFTLEYAKTDSHWYSHHAYTNGYRSRGNILGHHSGGDSDDIFVSLTKKFEDLIIGLRFDAERHGLTRSVVEKKYEGGINFKYQYLENLVLEADYELEDYNDLNNVANQTTRNHIITLRAELRF